MLKLHFILLTVFVVFTPIAAHSYIGPGMGGGAIAVIVGFFAAVFLALWGILYYPIKRALRNRKTKDLSTKTEKHKPK